MIIHEMNKLNKAFNLTNKYIKLIRAMPGLLWYKLYLHIYNIKYIYTKQLLWSLVPRWVSLTTTKVVQLHLCAEYAFGISDKQYNKNKLL